MYYVIQRHHKNHKKHFFAYSVVKYIAAKNTQNIIFEIHQHGEVKRKWLPKDDVILLTQDKELFRTTYERLEAISAKHLKKIDAVQEELNHEIQEFNENMQKEFALIKQTTTSN